MGPATAFIKHILRIQFETRAINCVRQLPLLVLRSKSSYRKGGGGGTVHESELLNSWLKFNKKLEGMFRVVIV